MADESTKRAAEEYLAARLSKEGQSYEDRQNREAAEKLGPAVWKRAAATVTGKIQEWNSTVGEQTFSVKETIMGDLLRAGVGGQVGGVRRPGGRAGGQGAGPQQPGARGLGGAELGDLRHGRLHQVKQARLLFRILEPG